MEVVALVSGGKDSCCAMMRCLDYGHKATPYGEILYMAGQLGHDPYNEALSWSSAIHFLVYCSAHLTSNEKEDVEQKLHSSYIARLDCSKTGSYPTILYVFASDLPKGAYVEIKPTLYVPSDNDGVATRELETGRSQPASSKVLSDWSAQHTIYHDSCCQVHTIGGRICSAVVSIINDIALKISSTTEQLYHSEEHLKAIARFCASQLAKILRDNDFSWGSITMLRFYYSVEHTVAADVISSVFFEAFTELGEADSSCIRLGPEACNDIGLLRPSWHLGHVYKCSLCLIDLCCLLEKRFAGLETSAKCSVIRHASLWAIQVRKEEEQIFQNPEEVVLLF